MDNIPKLQKEVFNDTSIPLNERKMIIEGLYDLRSDRSADESRDEWGAKFAPRMSCIDGSTIAVSDYSHDFGKPDVDTTKDLYQTIPRCGVRAMSFAESKLLEDKLQSLFPGIPKELLDILVDNGTNAPESLKLPITEFVGDEEVTRISGSTYTAIDLGSLGWNSDMSSLNRSIAKAKAKFARRKGKDKNPIKTKPVNPILQKVVAAYTASERVYIIDDIHSTAFIEQIKTKIDPGELNPFWCYLHTPQTIFDPAGKISPQTKPDVFGLGSNVDYAWYDMRKDRTDDSQLSVVSSKTFKYPLTNSNVPSYEIEDSKQKLVVANDVWLCVNGRCDDPTSYNVNFFTKIRDGSYAVFDNTSAAIKNRNYLSTKFMSLTSSNPLGQSEGRRAHMVAKRFGDQSQAESTCDPSIPYIHEVNGQLIAGESNGMHMFATKDRIAVVAALSYGAPMVLHMKSGKPKSKLRNILYINTELLEIPDASKIEIISQIKTYNIQASDPAMRSRIDSVIASIDERITNDFVRILSEAPTVPSNFFEYVDNISSLTTTCMALDKLKGDMQEYLSTSSGVLIPTEDLALITPTLYTQMRTDLAKASRASRTIEETLDEANRILETVIFASTPPPVPPISSTIRSSRRIKAISTPGVIKEVRFMWKEPHTHISTLENIRDVAVLAFARGCIARCPEIISRNGVGVDMLADILVGRQMEMILAKSGSKRRRFGMAPKRSRGSETITITQDQPMDGNRGYVPTGMIPFSGEGYAIGGQFIVPDPVDVPELKQAMAASRQPSYDWTLDLIPNELGQLTSERLLNVRFAIAALATLYNQPQLVYMKYHQAEVFIKAYLDTSGSGGFAPVSIAKVDSQDAEADLHTEVSYLHGYVTDPNPKVEFKARILDILWNTRGSPDMIEVSGFFGSIQDDNVDPTSVGDVDPIVMVNEYARSVLGGVGIDRTEVNSDTGTIPSTDSSIRITITADGFIDRRCGFFKNCILPILDTDETIQELMDQTNKR